MPGPWDRYKKEPPKEDQSYEGKILPIRTDAEGNRSLDFTAGITGSAWRALNLPGQVMRGEIDPGSQEGMKRVWEMAAWGTPVSPAMRSGVGWAGAPITKRARVKPPTAQMLDDAAGAGFEKMRATGAEYSSQAVDDLSRNLQMKLEEDGILGELAPKSFSILKKLQSPPKDSIATIQGLAAARRALRNARKDFNNPTDQLAAQRILRGLDEFIGGHVSGDSVAGSAAAQGGQVSGRGMVGTANNEKAKALAAELLKEANANYAAAKRSAEVTGIEHGASLRAAAANSGQNVGNSTRQRVASLLLAPKKIAGYSPEEIKALEGVVRGSPAANITRNASNVLGGGGGLGAVVSGGAGAIPGYMLGSPELAAAGAVGAPMVGNTLKRGSNALTQGALRNADKMVRSRSPLFEQMLKAAPAVDQSYIPPATKAALIAALLSQRSGMEAP